MTIPDPIEQGEARAELWEDCIQGNTYNCSCGRQCALSEVETLSPDPYAQPFCPKCIKEYYAGRKLP